MRNLRERLTPVILSIVTVLIYIDTHSLHPFLSIFAGELGAGLLMTGIIIASYSVFEDIFEILTGYIMDVKRARRKFLIIGFLGDAVNMFLYSIVKTPVSYTHLTLPTN